MPRWLVQIATSSLPGLALVADCESTGLTLEVTPPSTFVEAIADSQTGGHVVAIGSPGSPRCLR